MLWLTVGLVVVVAAVVVLLRIAGGGGDQGTVAGTSATADPQEGQLGALPVDVPPVTPAAAAACPAFVGALPLQLGGRQNRPVQADSQFAAAWGEPPLVVLCGVDRPAGFTRTAGLLQIGSVQWFVDDSDPDVYVWTAVDRPVYVQLTVPSTMDSAAATQLSSIIAGTLPAQEPQPAG